MAPLSVPTATLVPSELNAMAIEARSMVSRLTWRRVRVSQTVTVPFVSPTAREASRVPSPLKATAVTRPACPPRVATRTRRDGSHRLTVPSTDAEASTERSGLNASE